MIVSHISNTVLDHRLSKQILLTFDLIKYMKMYRKFYDLNILGLIAYKCIYVHTYIYIHL